MMVVVLDAYGSDALVGVFVVVVVTDAPGLERVGKRHEHEMAPNVLYQVVLVEAAVPRVVADHKKLGGRERHKRRLEGRKSKRNLCGRGKWETCWRCTSQHIPKQCHA